MNFKPFFWVVPVWALMPFPSAYAEGHRDNFNGANGVNRVIRTENGYTGVDITLDELSFSMPTNEAVGYERLDANGVPVITAERDREGNINHRGHLDLELLPFPVGGVDLYGNPRQPKGNKPSAYIGGQFVSRTNDNLRTQVDVGLQYEPITLYNIQPGWAVFFNLHGVGGRYVDNSGARPEVVDFSPPNRRHEVGIRVYSPTALRPTDGVPYRVHANRDEGRMIMEARRDGSLSFNFENLGATDASRIVFANPSKGQLSEHPNLQARWEVDATVHQAAPWADATQPPLLLFNTDRYNEGNVKRVTAMTRDRPYNDELDGSRVLAKWSSCRVRPHRGGDPVANFGGSFVTWGARDVGDTQNGNSVNDVNQAQTGYDAPGDSVGNPPRLNPLAFDQRYRAQRTRNYSHTIIEFDPIAVRRPDGEVVIIDNQALRTGEGARSRYQQETVHINLGMLARPVGGPIR